jgi:hypothetical protein
VAIKREQALIADATGGRSRSRPCGAPGVAHRRQTPHRMAAIDTVMEEKTFDERTHHLPSSGVITPAMRREGISSTARARFYVLQSRTGRINQPA